MVAGFCGAAAADAASGNVPSNFVNLICTMSDDILLAGSPCCLLLEGAANGLDTIKVRLCNQVVCYHDMHVSAGTSPPSITLTPPLSLSFLDRLTTISMPIMSLFTMHAQALVHRSNINNAV